MSRHNDDRLPKELTTSREDGYPDKYEQEDALTQYFSMLPYWKDAGLDRCSECKTKCARVMLLFSTGTYSAQICGVSATEFASLNPEHVTVVPVEEEAHREAVDERIREIEDASRGIRERALHSGVGR